jgi:K+-transporting ATPase KdpF subunit
MESHSFLPVVCQVTINLHIGYIAGAIIAIGILGYLLYALISPDSF